VKYPDATLATYQKRQMKRLKYASATLAKILIQRTNKTLATHVRNICNIHINTLATYV
jgi:hypothetical protein